MTLDTPNNEHCGNCYFCSSFIKKERIYKGFMSTENFEREIFLCKRYAPQPDWICRRNYGDFIDRVLQSSTNPMVNSKGWCGEWKPRKDTVIKL